MAEFFNSRPVVEAPDQRPGGSTWPTTLEGVKTLLAQPGLNNDYRVMVEALAWLLGRGTILLGLPIRDDGNVTFRDILEHVIWLDSKMHSEQDLRDLAN